ncbi:MAG: hypothetical protein KJ579_01150, partial [Verrucomicrobia bacterium]|nr:hypothetical protein [Verrucomicrobiota bacterium]
MRTSMAPPDRHVRPGRSRYLSLACALACVLALPAMAAPVRIAILAESGTEAAAERLTAALSANPAVVLLERADMARIAREKGLALGGLSTTDARKLGSLLGAQILVGMALERGAGPEGGNP